jgi:hypothetical protein
MKGQVGGAWVVLTETAGGGWETAGTFFGYQDVFNALAEDVFRGTK